MTIKEQIDYRWYFNELAGLFIGILWVILCVMTSQGSFGIIGLAILYRRFRRKKEAER